MYIVYTPAEQLDAVRLPQVWTDQQGLPRGTTQGQLRELQASRASGAAAAVPTRVAQQRPLSGGRGVSPDTGARGRGVTPEGRTIAR